jgi:glucose/arabinose dehydrogenase
MALHPDFFETPHVFLVYNYLDNSQIRERLVRYRYESGSLMDPVTLLEGIPGASNHNGSRLVIDTALKLFMTTGDAANTSTSQNLNSLNGKVLRLNLDGTVPDENPIQGSAVWSWGHRNPQGLVMAPSGILYSSEHGPSSDDEVNIIEKGRNYGWPTVKGFCDEPTELEFCADSNLVEPMAAWTPTLAVAGADFYSHTDIPSWNNAILVTSLKASRLVALKLSEDGRSVTEETPYFSNWFGRLRDLCISPSGDLYLAVSNRDGRGTVNPGDDRIIKISAVTNTTDLTGESEENGMLRIYPNPTGGNQLMIEYASSENAWVTVYNELGAKLVVEMIPPGQVRTQITLPSPAGLYLIRVRDGQRVISKMVIKHSYIGN